MSMLTETRKPPFYAVIYTSPPAGYQGYDFDEASSLLVALAATEPGYLGFEAQHAAEGRTVAVCYWDGYAPLAKWRKRAGNWIPASLDVDTFVCATGCLWPWQMDERELRLESAARSVA